MKLRPRTALLLLVWLTLPVIFIWLLRDVAVGDLRAILSSIALPELGALIGLNVVAMLLFSARWWAALLALGYRLPYLDVFRYRMAGFAVSYLTPGTQFGGEPVQVAALVRRHNLPAPVAIASVTLDKLFELLANFTFLGLGVTLVLQHRILPGLPGDWTAAWAGLLLAWPLAYLAALRFGKQPFSRLLAVLVRRLPGRPSLLAGIALPVARDSEGMLTRLLVEKPGALLRIGLAAGLIWALTIGEYWLALEVLGARLTLFETIAALTAVRLAFLMPLPGGMGALEAGQALAMQALGFSPALGIAISLWIRLRDAGLGVIGLACGASLAAFVPVQSLTSEPAQAAEAGD